MAKPTEAEFIYLGLRKDKWPHITVETVQGFLDDPSVLDDDNEAFLDRFFYYFDWYWAENSC
jgi:hypothetical protein